MDYNQKYKTNKKYLKKNYKLSSKSKYHPESKTTSNKSHPEPKHHPESKPKHHPESKPKHHPESKPKHHPESKHHHKFKIQCECKQLFYAPLPNLPSKPQTQTQTLTPVEWFAPGSVQSYCSICSSVKPVYEFASNRYSCKKY
jgi:hypothetical protein